MHSRVVIIGSGPAAHTAAVYLSRAELSPILYEGMLANGIAAGGQLTTTTDVENYPGFPDGVGGQDLMDKMRAQSIRFGTDVRTQTISKIDLRSRPFRIWKEHHDDDQAEPELTADALIIATGASARQAGVAGRGQILAERHQRLRGLRRRGAHLPQQAARRDRRRGFRGRGSHVPDEIRQPRDGARAAGPAAREQDDGEAVAGAPQGDGEIQHRGGGGGGAGESTGLDDGDEGQGSEERGGAGY
ncbi:thioredoxin-disulfide reductase [Xanthoria parietina]